MNKDWRTGSDAKTRASLCLLDPTYPGTPLTKYIFLRSHVPISFGCAPTKEDIKQPRYASCQRQSKTLPPSMRYANWGSRLNFDLAKKRGPGTEKSGTTERSGDRYGTFSLTLRRLVREQEWMWTSVNEFKQCQAQAVTLFGKLYTIYMSHAMCENTWMSKFKWCSSFLTT